jgi:hypothetical protein
MLLDHNKGWDLNDNIEKKCINVLGGVFVIITLVLFARPYFYQNDYFSDEATVANSIFTRDFFSLGASPLDYSQSAPLGYLYLIKILTIVFGNSVTITRLPSLAASALIPLFTFKIAKKLLSIKYSLFISGFTGMNVLVIYYASNFKQYSVETCLALLCLYCMGLYHAKGITLAGICVIFAVVIWFSFSSLFFVFGILVVIFFYKTKLFLEKKYPLREYAKSLCLFLIPLGSVIVNLIIWILPSVENIDQGARDFWGKLSFPLIPVKFADVILAAKMGARVAQGLGYMALLLPFAIILFIIDLFGSFSFRTNPPKNVKKYSNKCTFSICVSFLSILAVSYAGKYPIEKRMLLFIYPLCTIFIWFMAERYILSLQSDSLKRGGLLAACLLFIACGGRVIYTRFSIVPVYSRQQISYNINYIQKNINPEDCIYVFHSAIPGYSFLTNYEHYFHRFLETPVQYDKVIFGSSYRKSNIQKEYAYNFETNYRALKENVDMIIQHPVVYIIFSHRSDDEFALLVRELDKYGDIDLVNEAYETPLYKFKRNDEELKLEF